MSYILWPQNWWLFDRLRTSDSLYAIKDYRQRRSFYILNSSWSKSTSWIMAWRGICMIYRRILRMNRYDSSPCPTTGRSPSSRGSLSCKLKWLSFLIKHHAIVQSVHRGVTHCLLILEVLLSWIEVWWVEALSRLSSGPSDRNWLACWALNFLIFWHVKLPGLAKCHSLFWKLIQCIEFLVDCLISCNKLSLCHCFALKFCFVIACR